MSVRRGTDDKIIFSLTVPHGMLWTTKFSNGVVLIAKLVML